MQASTRHALHAFRFKVVQTFLVSGTPLNRVKHFRNMLQTIGEATLTDPSHLAQYIPLIEKLEINKLKGELAGEYVGIAFDGTSRLGEAVNVTGRFCDGDFNIRMRLLRFLTAKNHLKGQQLASTINQVVSCELGIRSDMIVSMTRDSAAVNGAACRVLVSSTYLSTASLLCISHTLNNVGARLSFDVTESFMTPWLELVGGRNPHRGAQALWRSTVHPQSVPGYSKVRWYAAAEIQFVIAENFHQLPDFLAKLDELDYGDATRRKLHAIIDDPATCQTLQLQLAAMLDLRSIVKATYALEGDRLEILLIYDSIEHLRQLGQSIIAEAPGVLSNVDALLRANVPLQVGVRVSKYFQGHGQCSAKVVKTCLVESELHAGEGRTAYVVKYDIDGQLDEFLEEEIRPLIDVSDLPERKAIIDSIKPAFTYLESRIEGTCDSIYSCKEMYQICKAVRILNPAFAARYLEPANVDDFVFCVPPVQQHVNRQLLLQQLPAYLIEARDVVVDVADVDQFTHQVLSFWRHSNKERLSEWRKAAQIVFAMSPNSASCERVFSLLANMYSDDQHATLADSLQASLMMRYNKRPVGSYEVGV